MDVRAALAALLGPASRFLIHRTTVILGRGGPSNVRQISMNTCFMLCAQWHVLQALL
jgi:hypothetical protein